MHRGQGAAATFAHPIGTPWYIKLLCMDSSKYSCMLMTNITAHVLAGAYSLLEIYQSVNQTVLSVVEQFYLTHVSSPTGIAIIV